jgi:hypothetical protein
MSARPQSVNDETPAAPRLRKDQRRRINEIVRQNREFPLVAIGLVRDFTKTYEGVKTAFDNDVTPTQILVTYNDTDARMLTQYQYSLLPTIILDSPSI